MQLRLTVVLKDGRELSGTYGYLEAYAREEAAMKWGAVSATLEEV